MAVVQQQTVYGISSPVVGVPQRPLIAQRDPTVNDKSQIGTIWVNITNNTSYILVSIKNDRATWSETGATGSGVFSSVEATTGDITADLGDIKTLSGNIISAGSVTADNGLVATGGGLSVEGNVTFDSFSTGILQSNNVGVIESTTGTDGQILIGGGIAPEWANITSFDNSVAITNGPNSIDLSVSGGGGGDITFETDAGNATTVAGVIQLFGGLNINTTGLGEVVTVGLDDDVTISGTYTTLTGLSAINNANTSSGDIISFIKSRAGGAVHTSDTLGNINFYGFDGTSNVPVAYIRTDTAGTITTGQVPGRLIFSTHPNSGADPQDRLIIDENGTFTVNHPDGAAQALFCNGEVTINGKTNIFGDDLEVFDGSIVVDSGNLTLVVGSINALSGTVTSMFMEATNGITVDAGGIDIMAGGLVVNAGGATITGDSEIDGNLVVELDVSTTNGSLVAEENQNDTAGGFVRFKKNRATAIIDNGDTLGTMTFEGFDGTSYIVGAKITAVATGTVATNQVPTDLEFWTHRQTTAAAIQRMVISSEGAVTINAPNSGVGLTVSGSGSNIAIKALTGSVILNNGSFISALGNLQLSEGSIETANQIDDATGTSVTFFKTRADTIVQDGDDLGTIYFTGDDGGGSGITAAQIRTVAAGTIDVDRVPGTLGFYTHPDSTGSITERMTIDYNGNVTINSVDSGDPLTISDFDAGVLFSDNSGVITSDGGLDGEIIIGVSGNTPEWGSLTSENGSITVTEGPGTIDIAVSPTGCFPWSELTTTPDFIEMGNAYICNDTVLVQLDLPVGATVGEGLIVVGKGTGGWQIVQQAGQTIHFGASSTTTGVTGTLSSAQRWSSVELVCITAGTDFVVRSSAGTITLA